MLFLLGASDITGYSLAACVVFITFLVYIAIDAYDDSLSYEDIEEYPTPLYKTNWIGEKVKKRRNCIRLFAQLPETLDATGVKKLWNQSEIGLIAFTDEIEKKPLTGALKVNQKIYAVNEFGVYALWIRSNVSGIVTATSHEYDSNKVFAQLRLKQNFFSESFVLVNQIESRDVWVCDFINSDYDKVEMTNTEMAYFIQDTAFKSLNYFLQTIKEKDTILS